MASRPLTATAPHPSESSAAHRPRVTGGARRLRIGLAATAALLVAAGCSNGDRLLVAEGQVGQEGTPIWAVEDDQPADDSTLVGRRATSPLGIQDVTSAGTSSFNQLGWNWGGEVLLAVGTPDGSRISVGAPGARQALLERSEGDVDSAVVRRGVFLRSPTGCALATGAEPAEEVGTGRCLLSEDERWIVSWSGGTSPDQQGGPVPRSNVAAQGATVRDLRSGSVRRISDAAVTSASVLGHDERVLLAEQDGDVVRLRLVDAADGSTVARPGRYDAVNIQPPVVGSDGFVLQARVGQRMQLVHVATDGERTVIDEGLQLQPVTASSVVTYLEFGEGPGQDALLRWDGDGEPEVLARGSVGAGAVDPTTIVALEEAQGRVRFMREGHGGELEESVVLVTDTSRSVLATRTVVRDDSAILVVSSASGTSLVEVGLHGPGKVLVSDWASLQLQSMDHDGTILFTGRRTTADTQDALVVVRPGHDPEVRGRVPQVGTALLHAGTIYASVVGERQVEVRSFTAVGERGSELLHRGKQVAGATWPELGGATETVMFNRALLTSTGAPR